MEVGERLWCLQKSDPTLWHLLPAQRLWEEQGEGTRTQS